MVSVKKIVLDVLKPHEPNALEFCQSIAKVGVNYHVRLIVLEVDKNTETLQITVEGNTVDFEAVQSIISEMGGSLHCFDEVEVQRDSAAG